MFIQSFSSLSTQTPACHPGIVVLTAEFDLPVDISELFPYINAVLDGAKLFEKPTHIRFDFSDRTYVLYPNKGMAAAFESLADAESNICKMIEYLNDLYEKRETITPDNSFYKPIPVMNILKILSRTNCKKCGFATCMAFAAELSKGEIHYETCPELARPERKDELIQIGLIESQP